MAAPKYRLSRRAVTDLEGISDHLAERSPSAADHVIDELFRTFDTLTQYPDSGTDLGELRAGLRVLVPSRPATNYLVFFYRMPNGVMISRVLHAARDWIGMLNHQVDLF